MGDSDDPKGYYALLGLNVSTSAAEIKSAYRRLAKELHPDINRNANAKARFQAIGAAYQVLGDPETRNAYDALRYTAPTRPAHEEEIEPIRCSSCGRITAQPRSIVFYQVVSVVLFTMRTPVQGIFCSECARKAS